MTDVSREFVLDTLLSEKAVQDPADNGDLMIEGYAADIGIDRQGEFFEPQAFEASIQEFLDSNPVLLYHHHNDQQLGMVKALESRPDGLWMKAVVPRPAETSPLLDVYEKMKRGMMRGLSVRGLFHRRPGTSRIYKADLAEISVTPFPVNPRTLFAVAQKAYPDEIVEPKPKEPEPTAPTLDEKAVASLETQVEEAGRVFEDLATLMSDVEAGVSPTASELTADDFEGKSDASANQRKNWAKSGVAMQDGSFPITHCGSDSYSNGAARSRAHSGNASESAIMSHIVKREKALGCSRGDD
jgi:HK97 family phage prohead protease